MELTPPWSHIGVDSVSLLSLFQTGIHIRLDLDYFWILLEQSAPYLHIGVDLIPLRGILMILEA